MSPEAQENPIFGVKCKNGHTSYYDKRIVCTAEGHIIRTRTTTAGAAEDELCLPCKECDEVTCIWISCEHFK